MLMVLIGSQLKIPMGKWWEADGVRKSLSNPKDLDLDLKLRVKFPVLFVVILKPRFSVFGTMARFAGKGALRATRVENEQARVIVVGWDPLSTKTALYWGPDCT